MQVTAVLDREGDAVLVAHLEAAADPAQHAGLLLRAGFAGYTASRGHFGACGKCGALERRCADLGAERDGLERKFREVADLRQAVASSCAASAETASEVLKSALSGGIETLARSTAAAAAAAECIPRVSRDLSCELRASEERLRGYIGAAVRESTGAAVPLEALERVFELQARVQAQEAEMRAQDGQLRAREAELHAQELELTRLRASNAVKGACGEREVLSILRGIPDLAAFEFRDASSSAGQSDLHVVEPASGRFVAVEVKNKDDVRASDVAKAVRDMEELQARYPLQFAGYAFISVRSPNIPGKGSLALEFAGGGAVPVLWWGCAGRGLDDGGGAAELATLFRALWRVAWAYAPLRQRRCDETEAAKRMLSAVERMARCRASVQGLHASLRAVKKHADACEAECAGALEILEQYVADAGLALATTATATQQMPEGDRSNLGTDPSESSEPVNTHRCAGCGRVYKTASGFRRHACSAAS